MIPNVRFASQFRSVLLRATTTALLAVAIICCYSSRAQAQWNEDGNNNIHNTNSGNVGIGTDTAVPNAKLVVIGDLGLGSNDIESWTLQQAVIESLNTSIFFGQIRDLHLLSNAYHNTGWKYKETGFGVANYYLFNGAHYWRVGPTGTADSVINWTDAMILNNSGNLGLGTTSPGSFRLSVNGNTENTFPNGPALMKLESSDALGANVGPGINFSGVHNGTTATTFALISGVKENATAGNYAGRLVFGTRTHGAGAVDMTRMIIDSTGNVGIGTASPGLKLHVDSASWAARFGRTASSYLDISGNQISAYNNGAASILHLNYANSGNVSLAYGGGDVGIGTINPGYKLHVHGGQINASGGLCIAGDCKTAWAQVTGTPQWTTSGSDIYYNTGEVSIGTTSPGAAKMRISSGASGASEYVLGGNPELTLESTSGTELNFLSPNTGSGRIWFSSPASNLAGGIVYTHDATLSNGSMKFNAGGNVTRMSIMGDGSVGIGTADPQSRLDVGTTGNTALTISRHNTVVSANDAIGTIQFWNNDPQLTTQNIYGSIQVKASSAVSTDAAAGYMTFSTTGNGVGGGPVERIRINAAGNVGLGTAVPGAGHRLDVQGGSINSSGGLCIAGDCKTDWSQVGGSEWTTNGNNINNTNSGNVGIGTTTPAARLEVKSAASAHNSLILNTTTAGFADSLIFQEAGTGKASIQHNPAVSAGAILFNTNGIASPTNTRMVITSTGTVGIGTTSPNSSYKLDVNGNTNVTGNINVTGTINAKYQDVAEWVPSTGALPAGTVVTLDPTKSNHVEASSKAYDTRVAGVISAQPGIALGEGGQGRVLVATTGRVRIKVDATHGPIQVGDLLVTSSVPGVAMRSQPIDVGGVEMHRPGTLIGKALEPLAKGQAEILVLLSLQ